MIKKLLLIIFITSLGSVYAQLTPPSELQSYYNNVDFSLTGTHLFDDLATKTISKHTNILEYGQRHNYIYNVDEDLANSANVILMYSGESRDKREYESPNNSHQTQTYNTEHVYPQSLIINNAKGDLHHLRTCDISINSDRGSKKFIEGSGNYGVVDSSWYPGDDWKGDVARMIMYLNLRYNESFSDIGTLNLFLKWNAEDPVSDFEKQRNEIITTAQGNRNPFIDNPYIATIIWGGTAAENTWGEADTEIPTVPTNIALSNITTSTIDVTWDASTDNNGIGKYEIYANGVLNGESTTTNYTVINLTPNTAYSITVLAKDIAGNESAQSTTVNGTTLVDNTPPTIPTDVTIASKSGTSLKITWTSSTDDSAVAAYNVYVDGTYNDSTTDTSFTITGLTVSTTYAITVLAKDTSNNESEQSTAVNGTTTDGSAPSNELFFSEYLEGGGNNKAIEIANFTGQAVSLANYAVKLGSNGADFGTQILTFTNETIEDGDVFVIGNAQLAVCASEVDIESTVTYFNGNDVLGLFKNDVLIDIIGKEGDTNTFGSNVTLKRKSTIVSPNVVFDRDEWEEGSSVDDCTNLGKHTVSTASIKNANLTILKMYPNPTNGDKLYFNHSEDLKINIYNVLGKLIASKKVTIDNNQIDISSLSKGIYLVKINSGNQFITKKLIKK